MQRTYAEIFPEYDKKKIPKKINLTNTLSLFQHISYLCASPFDNSFKIYDVIEV